MTKNMKALALSLLLLLLCLSYTVASAEQLLVNEQQVNGAFQYALKYVNHQVAYKLGGRLTVEQYITALAEGQEPGTEIGVDASALVINAYQDVVPNMLFKPHKDSASLAPDVSSSVLYHWNSEPITEEELTKGDLIFFKNTAGNIMGVSLFSHIQGNIIHFITASQSAGKVIISNINMNGDYWSKHFAGFARLKYNLK